MKKHRKHNFLKSYSLEALHADPSRLAHAIGPNLIEIRKFGDIFVTNLRTSLKITSYSLETLHADASRHAHVIGPNLIEYMSI